MLYEVITNSVGAAERDENEAADDGIRHAAAFLADRCGHLGDQIPVDVIDALGDRVGENQEQHPDLV